MFPPQLKPIMSKSELFYECYDILFGSKKFDEEIDCLVNIAKGYLSTPIEQILEIGCGTGNHSIELAKKGIKVDALDTDFKMLEIAKQKIIYSNISGIEFYHCSIEKFKGRGYLLATSLFNVVTYLQNSADLFSFMISVHEVLDPKGLFVFDCWNGVAAILDPPVTKTFSTEIIDKKVDCSISSKTDFFNQVTKLTYNVVVHRNEGNISEEGMHSFDQHLWTPQQIVSAVENAGFHVRSICPAFQPTKLATEKDWKVMFICQKLDS